MMMMMNTNASVTVTVTVTVSLKMSNILYISNDASLINSDTVCGLSSTNMICNNMLQHYATDKNVDDCMHAGLVVMIRSKQRRSQS